MTEDRPVTARKVHRVIVICDDKSHAQKVATVHRARVGWDVSCRATEDIEAGKTPTIWPCCGDCPRQWNWLSSAQQLLVENELQDNREVIGGSNHPPNHELLDKVRSRWAFECPLCGLRVDVRRETAAKIFEACAQAGVSEVRLSFLAASM